MSTSKKRENIWLNLGFNIVLPSLLLIKGKKIWEYFGEPWQNADIWIFVAAIAFPIIYGTLDLLSRRKWNLFSIVGILSVALTGGIGLMKFSREWMIIKEGAVPLLLGAAVLATAFTKKPLAGLIMMNDSVVDVDKIESAIESRGARAGFDASMKKATYYVAGSFLLSSVLNFALAACIFKSPAGTEEFNAEVGRMTALSFPVIALPTMVILVYAMFKLFGDITRLTGLSLEDFISSGSSRAGDKRGGA